MHSLIHWNSLDVIRTKQNKANSTIPIIEICPALIFVGFSSTWHDTHPLEKSLDLKFSGQVNHIQTHQTFNQNIKSATTSSSRRHGVTNIISALNWWCGGLAVPVTEAPPGGSRKREEKKNNNMWLRREGRQVHPTWAACDPKRPFLGMPWHM